jgi:NAD(P)-dependent dehydrogenase (short-subunit alcohol dehydrogenase family)
MSIPSGSVRVLVTGTSSGFGHGAAQALAARGHTVYATMRDVDGRNRESAQSLRSFAANGKHALHVIELDVTDDASVQAGVTRALELGGGIDTVINNAGVGAFGVHEVYTAEQVARLFDVNVVGSFRVARTVLPLMREARAGHLVFVSSSLGRIILPFMGPYTASKFAVEGMAESIAFELGPLGIDVTIVQPGAYGTEFMAHSLQPADGARLEQYGPVKDALHAFGQMFQEMVATGRVGDPREIYDTFVRVVETPKGQRPLRVSVDGQTGQAVAAVNGTCAQVQDGVMAAMGFGKN